EASKCSPEEAVRAAHVATNKVPSRFFRRAAFQKMYVHAEGFANIREIHKAAKLVEDKYGAFAENIAKQIDPHNPLGVVDAKAESKVILAEYKDIDKTQSPLSPILKQMVKDATRPSTGMWSWEKAKQFRSSVGRVIGRTTGPQKALLTRVYIDLTKKLGGAAKQYGLEKDWNYYNEL